MSIATKSAGMQQSPPEDVHCVAAGLYSGMAGMALSMVAPTIPNVNNHIPVDMITYPNAVDEAGNVHNINSITADNRTDQKYYCLGCDKEMVPVLCKNGKTPHFRHKVNDLCNQETYLHNLAKKYLANRFKTQTKFEVSYYVHNECPFVKSCVIFNRFHWKECSGTTIHTLDLKKQYDTCQIEGVYNGYRADVLLKNSKNPDIKPVFLEVSVSHDCSLEKLRSGIPIIEIKVQIEADSRRAIVENKGGLAPVTPASARSFYYNRTRQEPEIPFIMFHNFERETNRSDVRKLDRFALLKDGQICCEERCISCGEMESKRLPNTVFELNVLSACNPNGPKPKYDLYNLGFTQAMVHQQPLRHCICCFNYYNRCTQPMEFEVLNRKTGQMEKTVRQVPIRSFNDNQIDKETMAYKCHNWRLNDYFCRKVLYCYQEQNIFYWQPDKTTK